MVQRFGVPLPAVFIACLQRSLSVPKPTKPNRGQVATIVLFETLRLWLFLVIREGLGSSCETMCPRHTPRLTNRLRLALEPECLENPTATARESPQQEADSIKTLKLFVVSDVWRRSAPLSSTPSKQWWQSSGPRSGGPSPAACRCPLKLHRTLRTGRA
jgi:hypothetical protein